ncbi:Ca2+-transporting ATPase [Sulfuritortus calidifontis]|uniref:Ca2+-transporting ATPase n=1 Tax=Sulfuritortus calidifontis TaxID=1914471 RepID=A0A4V2UQT5_9PROT|nr:cation-translocating P-type ATPase [Sulfuritortus calidifontis]TCS72602.1 Ca2+-transporting ATPase [Sulfuritortus calidifontis]
MAPAPDPGETPLWHGSSVEATAEALQSDSRRGLTSAEAARRLRRHGPNRLPEPVRRGPWRLLLGQFSDFMILVLIAAAVVSGLAGEPVDALAILVIVLLNALIGFVQEYRAERAMAALKRMAAPQASVIRDGRDLVLDASELVPGDLVRLEAGNVVPADLRLSEVAALRCEEAALTGESHPVDKSSAALPGAAALAERANMAYKGTQVSHGRGLGLVVATGTATELGRIAALLSGGEPLTPLQKRLADFGRRLAWGVLGLCAMLFAAGVARGGDITLMFLTAVSLAVAAIPEALPAVVTISLALGARRMVRQQALIRRLPAVETLGSVTYICADKTGTLTQNRMQVARTWRPAADAESFYRALALNNDCRFGADGRVQGDATELALYQAALAQGQDKRRLDHDLPRVAELPFDAVRKRMSTAHRFPQTNPPPLAGEGEGGGFLVLVKGAPETLLPLCRSLPTDAQAVLEEMAAAGLRVMAFAWRRLETLPAALDAVELERDLDFLGFAGLQDPPRPEARQAVLDCRSAGITPVMITGDHPATAQAIARELGILDGDGEVITGPELARLDAAEFERRVADIRVYARVDPEQKLRIVQALQERGEFVAMTGDGVNDAPALKAADIGVAMGRIGTDVAREAASLVLLDDNFATIVAAVKQGRRIYDNIRKFVKYTMTSNSGEIWTLFLAPFIGLPIPLLPIHILWINLVTDGLPGLALAAEPAERGIMRRPPRHPKESIFAHGLWLHILWVGLLMGGVCLFTQAWAIAHGSPNWQAMVFTVLTLSQMGHVLAIRSERDSFFRQGPLSNRPLLAAVLLTFALQMAALYLPVLNPIFKTAPLSAAELGFCLVLSSVLFFGVELEKWGIRRGWVYRDR